MDSCLVWDLDSIASTLIGTVGMEKDMEKEPPMTTTATDQQNAENVKHERQARSVAIDFLRAIAILAVVSVHTLPVPLLGSSSANSGKIIGGGHLIR